MEFLKPLISISLLGIVIYAIGIILVEGGASRKQVVVTRSRKARYRLNSLSFTEFVFGLFLFASVFYVYKDNTNLLTVPVFWAIIAGLFIKFLLLVINTEKIRNGILNARFGTKVSIILLILWGGIFIFLLNQAKSEPERILTYLIASYLFLIMLLAKARLANRFDLIMVDITLKDGEKIMNRELLDETNDFLVLEDGELQNILISKDQVANYKVYNVK